MFNSGKCLKIEKKKGNKNAEEHTSRLLLDTIRGFR